VIERWTAVWNEGRLEWIPDLVADPCMRHHPGSVDKFTVVDNVERVRAGRRQFPGVAFENVVLTVDGEYVTSVYTMRWDAAPLGDTPGPPGSAEDGRREAAGIEVFRVVDGLITETWNVEPGPGPWR
jgi:hypothetical protein